MRTKRARWDIHMAYILHLIGTPDQRIAELMKISETAVRDRHRRYWVHGRA